MDSFRSISISFHPFLHRTCTLYSIQAFFPVFWLLDFCTRTVQTVKSDCGTRFVMQRPKSLAYVGRKC